MQNKFFIIFLTCLTPSLLRSSGKYIHHSNFYFFFSLCEMNWNIIYVCVQYNKITILLNSHKYVMLGYIWKLSAIKQVPHSYLSHMCDLRGPCWLWHSFLLVTWSFIFSKHMLQSSLDENSNLVLALEYFLEPFTSFLHCFILMYRRYNSLRVTICFLTFTARYQTTNCQAILRQKFVLFFRFRKFLIEFISILHAADVNVSVWTLQNIFIV